MRRLLPPLLWAAFIPVQSFAQGAPPAAPLIPALTLRQAQDAALGRHPDLIAAGREVEASEAAQLQAGARLNPTLSAQVEDTRSATRETTILLSQALELGGKRAARIAAAQRARDVAMADVRARRAEIRAAVTSAFFELLIAQERSRLAEASLRLTQRGSQAVSNRATAGKVSPIEDTRAKVLEAGIRIELLKARSEAESARQRLASSMAEPSVLALVIDASPVELPGLPDPAQLEQWLLQAPAVLRSQAELQRASALVDVEQSRRRQDLTISVGAKRVAADQRQLAVIGLSIPLPLFDSNQGAVLEAQRREDKARAELASVQLRTQAEARVAAQQLQAAAAEVDALQRDVLPGAQSAYEATVTGYELGKFGLLDVLDAQRTLLLTRAQLLQAMASAHRAAADIGRVLGEPVTTMNSRQEKP